MLLSSKLKTKNDSSKNSKAGDLVVTGANVILMRVELVLFSLDGEKRKFNFYVRASILPCIQFPYSRL